MVSRLILTTGDPDGIGWEVTAKALQALGPQKNFAFTVIRSPSLRGTQPRLNRFKTQVVRSLQHAARLTPHASELIEVQSAEAPAVWVEEAARLCTEGTFQGLVTAPLSKTSIIAAGFKDIGHTEILARVSGARHLFMGFVGSRFCVVLATGHAPLAVAVGQLTPARLRRALHAALLMRRILPRARAAKPVALVGLNPHAGEAGLIGKEERGFAKVLRGMPEVRGPLVPDAAFLPRNWKDYSVYVCPYHDQGLIPFKMIHGFEGGVHITLGLPFVRTSVDHGTAKDLFGLNRAEPGSMRDALKVAMQMCKENAS